MQRTLQRRMQQRVGRERDAETARDAILQAAQVIFARDGFSGARVDDIARESGYNKALIFHYFDDKLGLYQALMLRTKERLLARFEESFDRIFAGDVDNITAERVGEFTAEYLDTLFALFVEHPLAVRIMAWEAAEGWQTFVGCTPSVPDSWSRRALSLLERAQETGIVRADLDPHLVFATFISLPLIYLISLPRFMAMFPGTDFSSPAAIAHARAQITDLVLRGILSAPDCSSRTTKGSSASGEEA